MSTWCKFLLCLTHFDGVSGGSGAWGKIECRDFAKQSDGLHGDVASHGGSTKY